MSGGEKENQKGFSHMGLNKTQLELKYMTKSLEIS